MELNFSISLKLDKVKLNDINESSSIKDIKPKLSSVWRNSVENFNFIHKGQILKDDVALKETGITNGSLIYCLPKNDVNQPAAVPLSIIEVQQLLVSLRAAVASSNFRLFIKKLRTPEKIARLISECPALCKDSASLAYVQDPDLVSSLQNPESLTKIVEERPVLGRVLQIVCNLIASEITSPRRSHHVSYSIDALSDEEMEVDQLKNLQDSSSLVLAFSKLVLVDSSSVVFQYGSYSEATRIEQGEGEEPRSIVRGGSSSSQLITPAQLAAALANAAGNSSWGGSLSSSAPISGQATPSSVCTPFNTPAPASGSGAAGGASPGGSFITNEMFSQALQNALAASATRSSGSLAVPSSTASQDGSLNQNQPLENIEESLQLMLEMGIPDRDLSRQALQATNGDVQAAVNLIFSQWMADD